MSISEDIIRQLVREEIENILEGQFTYKANQEVRKSKENLNDLKDQAKGISSEEDALEHKLKINNARRDVADATRQYADAVDKETKIADKSLKARLQDASSGETEGEDY